MDYNRTLEIILNSSLLAGLVAAIVSLVRGRASKKRGMSAHEKIATSQIPLSPPTTEVQVAPTPHLGTPDWEALTRYWQNELIEARRENAAIRRDFDSHRRRCTEQLRAGEEHIDLLEAHIWQKKPPPPPRRRQTREEAENERTKEGE